MKRMIEKINKLSLPATILMSSIILGIFFYSSQISKQKSIENHQKKEYIAQRKKDCYNIYDIERKQHKEPYVDEYLYCEKYDLCFVTYNTSRDNINKFYQNKKKEIDKLPKEQQLKELKKYQIDDPDIYNNIVTLSEFEKCDYGYKINPNTVIEKFYI